MMTFNNMNTTTSTSTTSVVDDIVNDCLRSIATDAGLQSAEDAVTQQPYDVASWVVYLDLTEEESTTTSSTAAPDASPNKNHRFLLREFVGRRALVHLPRSYKLWKRQWEFLLAWQRKLRETKQQREQQQQKDGGDDDNANDNVLEYLTLTAIPQAFDRALWTLHAMPRVWMVYLEWILHEQQQQQQQLSGCFFRMSATELRRLINQSLQAVPLAQHDTKLWPVLLQVSQALLPSQSHGRLLKRYAAASTSSSLSLSSTQRLSEYAAFLVQHEQWGQAALVYQQMLNAMAASGMVDSSTTIANDNSSSSEDDDVWSSFLSVCSQHPKEVQAAGIPWEAIVRTALENTSSASTSSSNNSKKSLLHGFLWSQLADSWIRQGHFDLARSVYEEGMQKVTTVRDFSILYQAYLSLEEALLQQAADEAANEEEEDDEEETTATGAQDDATTDPDDWDILLSATTAADSSKTSSSSTLSKLAAMEFSLARAEHLTTRRPFWINAVRLRQNPNDVGEWLQRADLFLLQQQQQAQETTTAVDVASRQAAHALEEALKTVHCTKAAHGSVADLVTKLVQVYETTSGGGDNNNNTSGLDHARDLLDRVCNQGTVAFAKADHLAECWVAWIELELRHEHWDDALRLARQAVAGGGGGGGRNGAQQHQHNLTRSLRLWDLLLDLEESLGTVQTTKDAYNRALEIKAATVQHVLHFGNFLKEQKYFEESFTAYERGIALFAFPHAGAKLLWKEYIQSFLARYKGTKVERARDMMERCLANCPASECSEFFILNGAFEEDYGLAKRALSVYRNMCDKVPKEEKLTAYKLYIAKTTKYLGLTATRDIYQEAIEKLDDASAATLCLDFGKMETSLQQLDRARGVLTYGAQMADPRRMPEYWKSWNDFEIAHGNEETFREMLRVKRSVEAAFSTVNYNASGMSDKVEKMTEEQAMSMIASQEGMDLEEQRRPASIAGFVASKRTAAAASLDDVEERVAKLRKATAVTETAAEEGGAGNDDDAEIDIDDLDDIDAEIEEAAAEGAAAAAAALTAPPATAGVQDVKTKAVPAAVFGGLAAPSAQANVS